MERGRKVISNTTNAMIEQTILDEAKELIYGARQQSYGHPWLDFSRIAKIWEAIFGHPVTPEQVALCLIGVKISREVNAHKRDNLVDGAGYFGTLELVVQERERQETMHKVGWPGD